MVRGSCIAHHPRSCSVLLYLTTLALASCLRNGPPKMLTLKTTISFSICSDAQHLRIKINTSNYWLRPLSTSTFEKSSEALHARLKWAAVVSMLPTVGQVCICP
eukprot:2985375-Pyramimonas_sp.AAC.1